MIERLIPDMTFQESYEHSGRLLNVSVAPAETHQTSRLLNATTSPNVLIHKSVMASAAVPGVFPPVTLEARDKWGERQPYLPSRKWVDGSVSDDLPTKRLARLYGVNHYIVSQANPAVLPIRDRRPSPGRYLGHSHQCEPAHSPGVAECGGRHYAQAPEQVRHPVENRQHCAVHGQPGLCRRRQYPAAQPLLQSDSSCCAHLSPDEVMKLVSSGERSAWRKMEMIRVQTHISRTLDRIRHGV